MAAVSAGLLLYRSAPSGLQVLLVHPGGPFWQRKDLGAWSIPKGEIGERRGPARRGAARVSRGDRLVGVEGDAIALGSITPEGWQGGARMGGRGDADPRTLRSNTFEIEWPPRSGRMRAFPEVDRAEWFDLAEARGRILPAQADLLDASLVAALGI